MLFVQRLFSGFPGGSAGFGILLLRLALGAHLAVAGIGLTKALTASPPPEAVVWALGLFWILAGLLTVAGLLTPLVQIVVALSTLAAWASPVPTLALAVLAVSPTNATALSLAICAGVALLGPGAYSIDAYLFGRREISIPATRPR